MRRETTMSVHDDSRSSHGAKEIPQPFLSELGPGERILWLDRPVPRFFTQAVTLRMIGGFVWTSCILLVLVYAIPKMTTLKTFEAIILFLSLTPFVLLGLLLIASPLFEYLGLKHSWYALTDRQVIILSGLFRPSPVSYPLDRIRQVRVAENRGGIGNIELVIGVRVVDGLEESASCLVNIRCPEETARLLTEQVVKTRKSAPDTPPPEPLLKKEASPEEQAADTIHALPKGLLVFVAMGFLLFGLPFMISGLSGAGIPTAIFLVLLIVLLLQLRTLHFAKQSTRWPTTRGIVRESYVKVEHDGQSGTSYVPKVRYTYRVNGEEYANNEITAGQRSNALNREPAEAIVARYPEGRPVTVYYHPKKPGYSVLEPGRGAGNWIVLALLLACCLSAGIWLVWSWNGRHFTRFLDLMPWRVLRFYLGRFASPGG